MKIRNSYKGLLSIRNILIFFQRRTKEEKEIVSVMFSVSEQVENRENVKVSNILMSSEENCQNSTKNKFETHGNKVFDFDPNLTISSIWNVIDQSNGKPRPPRQHEFLEILLNKPACESMIRWLDRDKGVFRIDQPEKVVLLWEKVKSRRSQKKMNYDLFARGLRHYYQSGILIKCNRKYTFRFNRTK